MKWDEYLKLFEEILKGDKNEAPYDSEAFLNYVQLNESRQKRWLKKGELDKELVDLLQSIDKPLNWILITEPWCGDAAHIVPFIYKLSEVSDSINFKIELRDNGEDLIDNYLTNGGKSIPILVVRDENNQDLFVWGPRPKDAQAIHLTNRNDDSKTAEEKKMELQAWYNKNKGVDIQNELLEQFKNL